MGNKESSSKQTGVIMPEYGKQKILHCAESYRSIAHIFLEFQTNKAQYEPENRQGKIYRRQMAENQSFMAEQFFHIAEQLSEVAQGSYKFELPEERKYKQLVRCLKREGVEVKHIYFMEKENSLEMTMRTSSDKERIPASDVAELLGIYYDMRLRVSVKSPYFIESEFQSFLFVKEPAFCVLSGQAAVVKEGEEISGDNILISEGIDGHLFFLMADGVGSGKEACIHSEKVLDFTEKFLMAGYSKETAIQVLNGLILQDGEECAMSTLDMCDVNLYKGICEFQKVGACVSFHKREGMVEKIWIENLPLGAFGTLDLDAVRCRMEEGDYIVMITDGVLEGLVAIGQEERLTDFISRLTTKNPREMAQKILKYCISLCRGNIQDDMSVLVFGIWRN